MYENKQNNVVGIVKELSNSNLNQDTQEELIKHVVGSDVAREEESIMDKIFGKRNPQMYVTLLMSIVVLMIVLCLTMTFKNNIEFVKFIWNLAIPAITLLWGYAFGKSQSKD